MDFHLEGVENEQGRVKMSKRELKMSRRELKMSKRVCIFTWRESPFSRRSVAVDQLQSFFRLS